MEKKEFEFNGLRINGFLMLFVILAMIVLAICGFANATDENIVYCVIGGLALFVFAIIFCIGFKKLEPNEAMVMVFFGKYCGTLTKVGFHWVNPFMSSKRSLSVPVTSTLTRSRLTTRQVTRL